MKFAAIVIVLALALVEAPAKEPPENRAAKKRAVMVYVPKINYPLEAERAGLVGSGVAVLEVDLATGEVTGVRMAQSTGHKILDNETMRAFREARFRVGTTARQVKIPITFGATAKATKAASKTTPKARPKVSR